MQPHPRYEILNQMAVGDFATVYHGMDRELQREVAIKQIHPQFLADQRQLERYWQEAQLLASLEHPNIMTIYDIDRDRGWLILELLQGSLRDLAAGQPLDLDYLRVALVCSLQALNFLHSNGIIHGDVKPSNLMLDKRNWTKLGDFGLAQRAANDQGSLLKGATKYIAPERVSDQFGAVGPQSDLYSLGFSMYELMCGEQFDSLFPGLNAFGRDKQIAWMMWHAARDRQAPEIGRVLEGVPEDLQRVIQRLIAKDPNQRYANADQALRDLKSGMGLAPQGPSEEELAAEAAEEEARKKRKKRKLLIGAACVSAALCLLMILFPPKEKEKPKPKLVARDGVIMHLMLKQEPPKLGLDDGWTIAVRENDQLFLNDAVAEVDTLKKGDRLRVTIRKDDTGTPYQHLHATRPRDDRGVIKSVQSSQRTFVLGYNDAEGNEREMLIEVPEQLEIIFNGKSTYLGKPIVAGDLRKGDRVEVRHDAKEDFREAIELVVRRVVTMSGTADGVDEQENTVTFTDADGNRHTLPIAEKCEVVINGRRFLGEEPLGPSDIQTGDEIRLEYDTHVVKIMAGRILTAEGIIQQLVTSQNEMAVLLEGQQEPTNFTLIDQATIKLGEETVQLADLQTDDRVSVTYDAANPASPTAIEIAATRPADRSRWVIVIGAQNYNDQTLTEINHIGGDAKRVADTIVNRYRVAPDQLLMLSDPSRAQLQQQVTDFLMRIPGDSELVVYFAGHAYTDRENAYLAARDFVFLQTKETGVPLEWLVQQIENCQATTKTLLLDSCHAGNNVDLRRQPSSKALVELMDAANNNSLRKTINVVASCQERQRAEVSEGRGQFAQVVAHAFQGRADANGDNKIEVGELFQFVTDGVRSRTSGRQAPALLEPPEFKPPRLSQAAKNAIRELAVAYTVDDFDLAEVADLMTLAEATAPRQPEPGMLYGLALLKAGDEDSSVKIFSATWRAHSMQLLPVEGMTWALCKDGKYRTAVGGLVRLTLMLNSQKKADGQLSDDARRLLPWIGRIREFTAVAADEKDRLGVTELQRIDDAIAMGGTKAKALFQEGRDYVQKTVKNMDARVEATDDRFEKIQLRRERQRLTRYVNFSIEAATQRILDNMENE